MGFEIGMVVNTPPELFKRYLEFLKTNGYTVLALRDLAKYLDPLKARITTSP